MKDLDKHLKESMSALKKGGMTLTHRRKNYQLHEDREMVKRYFIRAFETVLENTDGGPTFQWREYYEPVIDWLHNNHGKGLALFGSQGTGKSVIIRNVVPMLFHTAYGFNVKVYRPRDFVFMDKQQLWDMLQKSIIGIDELGRESMFSHFGIKQDVIQLAIQEVEDRKAMLLTTSNMEAGEIASRYGEYILDRLRGNCKVVQFDDKSMRK